jgi:hypothetical protein
MVLGTVSPMSWHGLAVAVVVVSTPTAMVACTETVDGTAQRDTQTEGGSSRGYGYAENRCGLLLDTTVQEIIGADKVVRPYSGAVCQYVMSRHSAVVDVTFSWFGTGTLERERAVAEQKHAEISDIVVQRHQGFLARRSVTGNACSATAATNPGVVSWWVQVRGDAAADPCADAQSLLFKTLTSEL